MPTPKTVLDRFTRETVLREIEVLLDLLQSAEQAARRFPAALAEALRDRDGLEDGQVWASYLDKTHDVFSELSFSTNKVSDRLPFAAYELTRPLVNELEDFMAERRASPYRIVGAFIPGVFRADPRTGKKEQVYDVVKLEKYITDVTAWTQRCIKLAKGIQRKTEKLPAA